MSEIKLRSCPFCGGEAKVVKGHCSIKFPYVVVCQNEKCGASVGNFKETRKEAIEAWNTRKPIEKVVEQRNKAIDDFLEKCKNGVQNGELFDFVKWNNWNNCACEWFEKIAEQLKEGGTDE